MSNHYCSGLGKTKNRESDFLDVFFDVGSTKEVALEVLVFLRGLFEHRSVYVENIEIKTYN